MSVTSTNPRHAVVDDPGLHAVIQAVCNGLAVPRASVVPWYDGTRARSFLVADQFVLRMTCRADAATAYANERAAMTLLADIATIPKLMAHGVEGGFHWQLTTLCPGVPVTSVWPKLSQSDRRSLARSAARHLSRLHRIEIPAHGLMDWRLGPVIARCRTQARDRTRLTTAEFERAEACIALLDTRDRMEDRLVHGDWHFGNLLCDGSRVSGIVDLEWTGRGSFARDLCIGDYFEAQAPGSWSVFLSAFIQESRFGDADLTEIAKWTLLWKLYQVSTRENAASANANKQVLMRACEYIEQVGFRPPGTADDLLDFLAAAT